MDGDPKGSTEKGSPSGYHYTGHLVTDRWVEIGMWSIDAKDLKRLPTQGYVGYRQGKNPEYPLQALRADLAFVRDKVRDRDAE